jgi:drug/metabolite transporter (DMT)-like permease
MYFLAGSIILSSYLTLAFKMCERYRISIFQAIVFNYLVCVLTGSIVNGAFPFTAANLQSNWMGWALVMGLLFIILFNIIGFTAQKIGVAVASVANKLSLVIPFLFSIFLYHEKATGLKIAGIAVALLAVILTCYPAGKNNNTAASKRTGSLLLVLPAVLFIGSGLLDTLIKYAEQTYLNEGNKNAYLITCFATAFSIGFVILLVQLAMKKTTLQPKAILAGILIGIPNYFSIWCLVRVLSNFSGNSSAIIPINNMGIVLFSSVMAWLLFKEKLSAINWLGIALAIGAISLIAFG